MELLAAANREMPNSFTAGSASEAISNLKPRGGVAVVVTLVVLAVLVVAAYTMWPSRKSSCPKELHRHEDGHLSLVGTGKTFSNMNEFEQWFNSSGEIAHCPLPLLTGARRERQVLETGPNSSETASGGWPLENTSARTPIYKVDDYEFSRIFGNERDGHMVIEKQNFNVLLEDRQFDWADLPVSAESRRAVYAGLREGFTANGMLSAATDPAKEAAARYGERAHTREDDQDVECKLSREAREVAAMVEKAYANEPDYEPVITKVGPNHWEVNELKPRHRKVEDYARETDNRILDPAKERVRTEFKYEQDRVNRAAIDPYFPADPTSEGELPWRTERYSRDPWYGPVPGMERMMGPTFDRASWLVPAEPAGPHPLMVPETPN